MNRSDLANQLLSGLLELEKSGDLVITHSNPSVVSDRLCNEIVQKWAEAFLEEPPIEVVIESGTLTSAGLLQNFFLLAPSTARSYVDGFVQLLLANRTAREVAELITHQGPREVALGAYYCIALKRGEYYSLDYLDWRKSPFDQ